MEWWIILSVGLVALLSLFMSGLPIYLCFLVINVTGVTLTFGQAGFGMFINSILESTSSESLTAVALFIVMGEYLFRSGAIDVAFRSCDTLIGKVRGRQYYLCISLTTFIGALAGSAMGVAAMLGRSLYPAMVTRGYDPKLSIGTILAGASLAPIIPPSVVVIIIGALADTSISALLIAGIIPGLLLSALFLGYVVVRVKLEPALSPGDDAAPARKATARDRWLAVWDLTPINLILAVVMGFLMAGICTPSESAALGVAGAIVAAWYYKTLSWKMTWELVRRVHEDRRHCAGDHRQRDHVLPTRRLYGRLGQACDLGRDTWLAPASHAVHDDGVSFRLVHVLRPGRATHRHHPDLPATVEGARVRSGVVLDLDAAECDGRRHDAAVRLHDVRVQGRGAECANGHDFQGVVAVRGAVHRLYDHRRDFPWSRDLATPRPLGFT